MILISNLAQRKEPLHFLKVELIGTESNRGGLGAKVKVSAGSQTYTKVQDAKSGYLSQSLFPLYFGLGDSATVEQIGGTLALRSEAGAIGSNQSQLAG